jgi:D-hydroxyproline dehydrogenase subunit beta
MIRKTYDLAVVGAGILGLAHALAAVRTGKRVIVVDRDAQANGASIRNFGFAAATGQERGTVWRRARRSQAVWAEVALTAGIAVEHRGVAVVARRPEARAVLEAFMETEMGEGCALLGPDTARDRAPMLAADGIAGVLWSEGEIRVESRLAIPAIARWLAEAHGVAFLRGTAVHAVAPPALETTRGRIEAEACIVCPGDDLVTLFPDRIAAYGVTRCKLHMMRLASPGWRLPAAVMSDLGIGRYGGYAALPDAEPLRRRLAAEQAEAVANGVHLIVVQGADGSLVVGDSHHYGHTPDPFAPEAVDALILDEYRAVFAAGPPPVIERWTGTYASADRAMFVDAPADAVRLVMVTSGTGASTAFAIAEEVVAELFGSAASQASLAASTR